MAGVDLNIYKFDFDLTFAVLLMNPDGTIYHRYGTRDYQSAMARMSMQSLVKVMKDSLADHVAYKKKPSPPKTMPRATIEQMPSMARLLKKNPKQCFHCHMVYDGRRDMGRQKKQWDKNEIYRWPLPDQIGLLLDREDQVLVTKVKPSSVASEAGLKAGDRLLKLNGQHIRTHADVQWVLENAGQEAGSLTAEINRRGITQKSSLNLKSGWKKTDPLTVSWRPTMWATSPKPGFGGAPLKPAELKKLGLAEDAFSFRVRYIVTWGKDAYTGRNAVKAGIRKGDVVVAIDGKSDFESGRHYHSWFRLTRKIGEKAAFEIFRNGKRMTVLLPVIK